MKINLNEVVILPGRNMEGKNFNRSKEEVEYLFNLFRKIEKMSDDFVKYDYKFHHTGDKSLLPQDMLNIILYN